MNAATGLDFAIQKDQQDPLRHFRNRFVIEDSELIYLDGNSLGRLPKAAAELAHQVIGQQWGHGLIRSWQERWLDLPAKLGCKIARIIGASPEEVLVADSTSVNLFKLALATMQAIPERNTIITDDLNFPSDIYVLQSTTNLMGNNAHLEILHSSDDASILLSQLDQTIASDTALVSLCHTVFKSGFTYDLPAVSLMASQRGSWTLWDVSHSVGVIPLDLAQTKADLAVGCTYKFLNGGPGSPAFLYISKRRLDQLQNPISGWFGTDDPFAFDLHYQPANGIQRFLSGTPFIVSAALMEPGIDLVLEAGLERIRIKSIQQTQYVIDLFDHLLVSRGYQLVTPRTPEIRGSQITLRHSAAKQIVQKLHNKFQIITDFRQPDLIRLGIAPLYTSYEELWQCVQALHEVI